MPSLGALITARRKALSLTYEGLAERSDGKLTKQRWQQLGTDTRVNKFPEPRTLELIADTIGVGVDRVILATAVTLGVKIPSDRSTFATLLPPNADELTQEQRDAVIAVIRAMRPQPSTGALRTLNDGSSVEDPVGAAFRQFTNPITDPQSDHGTDAEQDAPSQLPAAARTDRAFGGKSQGRRRREEQDRAAEADTESSE